MKLTEIANPAAVSWRWTADYEGFGRYVHEVCWIRGTQSLQLGTCDLSGKWHSTSIDRPERFGFDGTLKGARKAAHAFVSQPTDTVSA